MRLLRHLRHLRHLRVLDQPDFRVSFYFFFVYLAQTHCLKKNWLDRFLTHCVSPRKWKTIFPYICELHNNEVPFFMRDGLLIVLFCQLLVMIFHFQASSSQNCYIVALPGLKGHFSGLVGQYRADGVTEMLGLRKFDSASTLSDFIASNLHFFTGQDNSALIAFLASVVLSRGIRTIKGNRFGTHNATKWMILS